MNAQRKLTGKDVATLAQITISAFTVGACVIIVAIPFARVAFRISVWFGIAVVLAAITLTISPLFALLGFVSKKE